MVASSTRQDPPRPAQTRRARLALGDNFPNAPQCRDAVPSIFLSASADEMESTSLRVVVSRTHTTFRADYPSRNKGKNCPPFGYGKATLFLFRARTCRSPNAIPSPPPQSPPLFRSPLRCSSALQRNLTHSQGVAFMRLSRKPKMSPRYLFVFPLSVCWAPNVKLQCERDEHFLKIIIMYAAMLRDKYCWSAARIIPAPYSFFFFFS